MVAAWSCLGRTLGSRRGFLGAQNGTRHLLGNLRGSLRTGNQCLGRHLIAEGIGLEDLGRTLYLFAVRRFIGFDVYDAAGVGENVDVAELVHAAVLAPFLREF